MQKQNSHSPTGFTLIELSFAILFLAILLLTIALITSEIVGTYRKGVSVKTINQVGRELIEDFRFSITNSPATSKTSAICNKAINPPSCNETNYQKLTSNVTTATIQIHSAQSNQTFGDGASDQFPMFGVFCTGAYSYLWNSGYVLSNDYTIGSSSNVVGDNYGLNVKTSAGEYKPALLRIRDPDRQACAQLFDNTEQTPTVDLLSSGNNFEPADLISSRSYDNTNASAETPIAIYDFFVSNPVASPAGDRLFYSGSFILATLSGGVNINTDRKACTEPTGSKTASSLYNYCAINKFNFAVQSSNAK